jgi:phospholipase/carboxylesterase
VPPAYRPAPLLVILHGAGGDARQVLPMARPAAGALGILVVAPESRGRTWDVIRGGYGPDVAFLDAALAHVFARQAIDPARLAVGGFSDGASYALSLALGNGALFAFALAFSPGFAAPARQQGRPRLFISHGTRDEVLPIGPCSRRLVPAFRHAGYDVLYREFEGGHWVPPPIAREAMDWLAAGAGGDGEA